VCRLFLGSEFQKFKISEISVEISDIQVVEVSMNPQKKGTALITGASSGIGESFARALAARGFDLILVARRKEKLENIAANLERQHQIEAEAMVAELSDEAEIERVVRRAKTCPDLVMLVNNAGFGSTGKFHKADLRSQLDMVHVHVVATMALCHAVLPGMLERGRGVIINVSSVAGFIPAPGSATYNSTKSFLNIFSESLQAELRGRNIIVQSLCPGYTRTEFHSRPLFRNFNTRLLPGFFWMSSQKVVDTSLRALNKNKVICVPGLHYRLIVFLLNGYLFSRFARWVVNRRRH
jgi:short-subunit dehydrogenase